MAVVDQSSVDVPLSLFSSLDTELSPADIPEGISPDNQDIVYLPGSVSTRPALQRVFVSALEASGTVVYEKSFITPSKNAKNLYLTNDGILWVEDKTNNPGVATQLFASTATMASSVTAFGREYIALSDGVHGADIPIQYDGANLWRVTQDGPAAPPMVNSIALPSVLMAQVSIPSGASITSITPSNPIVVYEGPIIGYVTYYPTVTFVMGAAFSPGIGVTVSGNSRTDFNTSFGSITILSSTSFTAGNSGSPTNSAVGNGGTVSGISNVTLIRANNLVAVNTANAHGLKVGYQAQISGISASAVGGGIASIVLKNEALAGVATVTTNTAHGLLPNNFVNIAGVTSTTVGTNITYVVRMAQVSTITMASAHGLQIGSVVNVACSVAGNSSFNGQWYVVTVPTTTTFTYLQVDIDFASTVDAGSVTYVWPLANANPEMNYFTVLTAPTATTFTVGLSYTDGSWSGGTVTFAWNGNFYVTAVSSSTVFQYQQYGPNAFTTVVGTVTPYGQATPGIHQCQQCFLLASGAITEPSPPTTFIANGGQYLSITNLAIGPSNVAGRILLFTGAGGAYFFYIPQPAEVNGLMVSTATQVNDNVTTSVLLDFSDATLYAAIGCSIPGNNLAAQDVLGPCAGFFTYTSRLQAWGEYNKVQNFLNMGFAGGFTETYVNTGGAPNTPLGWTANSAYLGLASNGRISGSPCVTIDGPYSGGYQLLSQSAYLDPYGDPILLANTQYSMRVWLGTTGSPSSTFFASITSVSTSFSITLSITPTSASGWYDAVFSGPTPATIPFDMMLNVGSTAVPSSSSLSFGEVEMIYTEEPYMDTQERLSYVDNPEGFDGLTGILGPEDDLSPIMNHGVLRNTLYIVTGNGVHETIDNGATEPSGWSVEEVDDECGAWSIASVARNPQGIGSAGKGFMSWSGPDGAQIFTGRNTEKISQEIQSLWDSVDQSLVSLCWAKNDQANKRCYYGIPLSASQMQVLVLDYRNLSGENIGSMPPVHISFTGKMIASDLTRKWTKWNINAYCGELMYRPGSAQPVMNFGGVNPSGAPNVYTLNTAKYTDDDFGIIPAYYTTYFFVSHEMEMVLQLGSHRKQYDYLAAFVEGIGTVAFTPYLASLSNPFGPTPNIVLSMAPLVDIETQLASETAGSPIASRCAFKIAATPLTGQTDSYFNLQKLVINMKKAPWQWVRGSNTGAY